MHTLEIKIYSFSELTPEAQQKAIDQHRNFLESLPVEIENESGELEEIYGLRYEESEIIENIEVNEYLFFFNGDLCSATTYTGKHPEAGKTEVIHKGVIYELN